MWWKTKGVGKKEQWESLTADGVITHTPLVFSRLKSSDMPDTAGIVSCVIKLRMSCTERENVWRLNKWLNVAYSPLTYFELPGVETKLFPLNGGKIHGIRTVWFTTRETHIMAGWEGLKWRVKILEWHGNRVLYGWSTIQVLQC